VSGHKGTYSQATVGTSVAWRGAREVPLGWTVVTWLSAEPSASASRSPIADLVVVDALAQRHLFVLGEILRGVPPEAELKR
jgi:hypothetical protein